MNNAFETKQRATELLKETLSIWRQSDQSDYLEGLENDPVFSLLLMAVAYQGNEIDNEIERFREEVFDEFARILTPYEIGHATPASMVVQTALNDNFSDVETTPSTVFHLESHPFIPLFNSRIFNATVGSVVRIDGRRWKVTLDFAHPIKDISGLSFAIEGLEFHDITVSIGNYKLSIIKPWDYSELPFNDCFSPLNIFYNRQQTSNYSMLPMDLFARHNVRMFFVDKHCVNHLKIIETEHVELIFEFSGISDNFLFDKSHFLLNTMVLINASLHEVTLSSSRPFARIAGFTDVSDSAANNRQFLHLVQPKELQFHANTELEVRRTATERFNQGSLVKLLNCILNKYHSDFYAFQELKGMESDKMIYNLNKAIRALSDAAKENNQRNVPGVYLLLKNNSLIQNKDLNLSVTYLTTSGAAINSILTNSELQVESSFDKSSTKIISTPIQGTDEITGNTNIQSLLRYFMLSGDRIVTPADIKAFCHKELITRYELDKEMIRRIVVSQRQTNDRRDCGHVILVEIILTDNPFVKRNFGSSIPTMEILMQKMMEIRSSGIYPINVHITIENL